jgi:hypothetical protein
MFKNLMPLRSEVKVRALPLGEVQNELGIFIPTASNSFAEKLFKAEIVECGPDVETMGCGDIVLCQYHTGIEIAPDIIVIKEADIVGILQYEECLNPYCEHKNVTAETSGSEITD